MSRTCAFTGFPFTRNGKPVNAQVLNMTADAYVDIENRADHEWQRFKANQFP